MAVQTDLHERLAERNESAGKERRFQRANQIRLAELAKPLSFLRLSVAKPRHQRLERIGHLALVFD